MGEREREREKCCFCLQNDLKEPQKCKKCILYIASQKAWFTAFITIIKKVEHTHFKRAEHTYFVASSTNQACSMIPLGKVSDRIEKQFKLH